VPTSEDEEDEEEDEEDADDALRERMVAME